MSDRDIPESETDWVANSPFGFGFGYTASQAVTEMMKHVHADGDVEVTLVEHTGNVRVGPTGIRVEGEYVGDRSVTIPAGDVDRLRDAALATIDIEHAIEE